MNYLRYILLSLIVCISSAYSQPQKSDSTKTYYTEPVVVTGTQEGLSRKYVPASVSVVTSSDLQSSGQISLLDALSEEVPGLYVPQRGVIGYGIENPAGTISIRGLSGNPNTQVLVMIDGVPQFMGLYGHPLPDSYLSQDAVRVEVIRGPASMLYGTNAMGGVINIITKKAEQNGVEFTGGASYGSFDTQEYNGGLGYNDGRFNILVSGDHDQTDGSRSYSSFNTNDGYLNAGYNVDENFDLHATGSINKFKTYDPGPESAPLIDNWFDILRSSGSISLDDKYAQTDGSLKLFYSYGHHSIFGGFLSDDRNLGGVIYQNFRPFEGNVITVGEDFQHYGGGAYDASTDYGIHYIDESGIYAMVEQFLMDQIMVDAGARFVHNITFGNQIVPSAGISWGATNSTTLKASVSEGYRNPSIGELYIFFPLENPNLKPEKMWDYEIGLLQGVSDRVAVELTGFVEKGSNLIEGGWATFSQFVNSGSFTHKGIEFGGHCVPIDGLKINANYSFVEPGQETYETPKHKLFVGVNYVYDRATANLTFQHIAVLYGADGSQEKLPDYTLLGARVSYQVAEFVNVYVSGENLFNSSYQTIYDYPMPGRTLFAGLNLSLGTR
ncbi:MAG TPA: TonB-dependent receptor [Candidatus Acidoferrales bacterium]|nr:TonB-dependent receptor [Candidatus Acidoferrales bacterium]